MKVFAFTLVLFIFCNYSCSQISSFGPGYNWNLFKNTPNWELAKAVADEDTTAIYKLAKGKDLNLKDPEFGRTLLLLAVGNDKPASVLALLNLGVDVHLRDKMDESAIHEAVSFIELKKHTLAILKHLIDHGANVNDTSNSGKFAVPLEGAVVDSGCAKLLLRNGANLNYRDSDSCYTVWLRLTENQGEAFLLTRELIIEKELTVPNPILYTYPNHEPKSFRMLLNEESCTDNSKCRIREELLNYIK